MQRHASVRRKADQKVPASGEKQHHLREKGRVHLIISVLSSPIFSRVKGMLTLAYGLQGYEWGAQSALAQAWQRAHMHCGMLQDEPQEGSTEPAEVNDSTCQRLIQWRISGTKSGDIFAVAESSCKRKAQRDSNIL